LKVEVIKKQDLKDIPSASGVEMVNGLIYIIGDDSPFLYCLDHALTIIQQIALFKTEDFTTGRIPKSLKPDLECMTSLVIHDNHYLLIIGSGANEKREKGFLVKLPTKFNKNHIVQEVSFSNLFNLLRSNQDIVADAGLNLEGAAASESKFILFNRANGAAPNTALIFNMEEFLVFLLENQEMIPFPEIIPYTLPVIEGIQAGFSGASVFNDLLFFTASVEHVADAINDGVILGSFVGTIGMRDDQHSKQMVPGLARNFSAALVEENKQKVIAKVESISIYEKENDHIFIALAVTDNDMGNSLLLMLEINIE
jgi:hypothetical protein